MKEELKSSITQPITCITKIYLFKFCVRIKLILESLVAVSFKASQRTNGGKLKVTILHRNDIVLCVQ